LEELQAELKNAKLDFSYRTSVHVHVNVQDLTNDELMNFMYVYMLLEEPMVNFCGRERKGNRFCLRISDAEGFMFSLNEVFRKGVGEAIRLPENDIRYSSMNIASIRKYGSVEFRAMRGTMDVETINIWCNALISLREFSKRFKEPKDIVRAFLEHDPKDFMKEALGEYYTHFTYPRMVKEVQRSYSLSLDLPFVFKAYEEPKKVEIALDGVEAAFWEFKRRFNIEMADRQANPEYIKIRIHQGTGVVQVIRRGGTWLDWMPLGHYTEEQQEQLRVFDQYYRTTRPRTPRAPLEELGF
jgi:hypothetical protein